MACLLAVEATSLVKAFYTSFVYLSESFFVRTFGSKMAWLKASETPTFINFSVSESGLVGFNVGTTMG